MSNINRKEAEQFLRSIDNRIEDLLGLNCYNRALNALTELLDKTWEQGFQDHERRDIGQSILSLIDNWGKVNGYNE